VRQGEIAWIVFAANFDRFDMVNVNCVGMEHHVNRLLADETFALLRFVQAFFQFLPLVGGQSRI
jgi:hypothetical protein